MSICANSQTIPLFQRRLAGFDPAPLSSQSPGIAQLVLARILRIGFLSAKILGKASVFRGKMGRGVGGRLASGPTEVCAALRRAHSRLIRARWRLFDALGEPASAGRCAGLLGSRQHRLTCTPTCTSAVRFVRRRVRRRTMLAKTSANTGGSEQAQRMVHPPSAYPRDAPDRRKPTGRSGGCESGSISAA